MIRRQGQMQRWNVGGFSSNTHYWAHLPKYTGVHEDMLVGQYPVFPRPTLEVTLSAGRAPWRLESQPCGMFHGMSHQRTNGPLPPPTHGYKVLPNNPTLQCTALSRGGQYFLSLPTFLTRQAKVETRQTWGVHRWLPQPRCNFWSNMLQRLCPISA